MQYLSLLPILGSQVSPFLPEMAYIVPSLSFVLVFFLNNTFFK